MTQAPVDATPVRRRGGSVRVYTAGPVRTLSARDRHLVRRFSWGLTPSLSGEVLAAGGARRWFEQQLVPATLADPSGDSVDGWFPSIRQTPATLFARQRDEVQGVWEVGVDLSRWTTSRRVHSRRQLHEVMTDFWSNLLHVSLFHDEAVFFRMDYDRAIRARALTSFDSLLRAAVTHPAMGLFLDNATSTKQAPNENLGRELLELHTVGVDGGYTEDHVKASARLLTGYRVDLWPELESSYRTADHHVGPLRVLGFSHANRSADGRAATSAYLTYLANHPRTARRLAHRLCVRFVSDTPSAAIVAAVAKAYLANKTAIKPTLRAMVDHPDFDAAPMSKVRMPMEDYVAAVRALGIKLQKPTSERSFANALYWHSAQAGQAPYEWPAPNGHPEVSAAWASAGRVLTSLSQHQDLASRWWPVDQASFPSEASLLPAMPATLQQLVDHLALRVLGQKPGVRVSAGIAHLLGMSLSRTLTSAEVDSGHDYWLLRRILTSLLDSPLHLHR